MNELVIIDQKPLIPSNWNYDDSVSKMKLALYKWKNMTVEMANELWIAKEQLVMTPQESGALLKDGTKVPRSWTTYCNEIGSQRQIVNRWLNRWFTPEVSNSATPELPMVTEGKYNIIYADPPWRYFEDGLKNQSQHYNTMSLEDICQ